MLYLPPNSYQNIKMLFFIIFFILRSPWLLQIASKGTREPKDKKHGPIPLKTTQNMWKCLSIEAPPATRVVKFLHPKVLLPWWIDTHRPIDLILLPWQLIIKVHPHTKIRVRTSNGSAVRALNYRQIHTHPHTLDRFYYYYLDCWCRR